LKQKIAQKNFELTVFDSGNKKDPLFGQPFSKKLKCSACGFATTKYKVLILLLANRLISISIDGRRIFDFKKVRVRKHPDCFTKRFT